MADSELGLLIPLLCSLGFCVLIYLLMRITVHAARAEIFRQKEQERERDDDRKAKFEKGRRAGQGMTFYEENGYSFDWILVYEVVDESFILSPDQKKYSMKNVIIKMNAAGLETKQFYSVQRDEVYIKIRGPPDELMKEADRANRKMLLDPIELRKTMEEGREGKWDGRKIVDELPGGGQQCEYEVYEYIYGKYEVNDEGTACKYPKLYKKYDIDLGKTSEFRDVDRIMLIRGIIEGPVHQQCCGLDLNKMQVEDCIIACFPLHNEDNRIKLAETWLKVGTPPWAQPIHEIRDYFGEKIALYFAFLAHYTTWLFAASILGFGTWAHGFGTGAHDSDMKLWYSVLMGIWSTLIMEYWKRNQSTYCMKWGMVGFESTEEDRPEYRGIEIESPINGERMIYYPASESTQALIISATTVVGLMGVVVACLAGIFALKVALSGPEIDAMLTVGNGLIPFNLLIPAFLVSINILVMSEIWAVVAEALTNFENHRTDTLYIDALTSKTFLFQFVNAYAACFYIAFVKEAIYDADYCVGSCMLELNITLGVIFITDLTIQNLSEIIIPYIKTKQKEKEEADGADPSRTVSDVERAYLLEEYDTTMGPFESYRELYKQFGYATLFSVSFPLAPMLAFLNNWVEMRVDGWVLLQRSRRAIPEGAEDIGTWQVIFELTSVLAVMSNAAIICFVSKTYVHYPWYWRCVYFAAMEHAMLFLKVLFSLFVEDCPESTNIQIQRQEFIESKVIDNEEDDDVEFVEKELDPDKDIIDEIHDGDEDTIF